MNKSEAHKILSEQLARFSGRSYSEVVPLVEAQRVETYEGRGESGTEYELYVIYRPRAATSGESKTQDLASAEDTTAPTAGEK